MKLDSTIFTDPFTYVYIPHIHRNHPLVLIQFWSASELSFVKLILFFKFEFLIN